MTGSVIFLSVVVVVSPYTWTTRPHPNRTYDKDWEDLVVLLILSPVLFGNSRECEKGEKESLRWGKGWDTVSYCNCRPSTSSICFISFTKNSRF